MTDDSNAIAQNIVDSLKADNRLRTVGDRVEVRDDLGEWQSIEQPNLVESEQVVRSRRNRGRTTQNTYKILFVQAFEYAQLGQLLKTILWLKVGNNRAIQVASFTPTGNFECLRLADIQIIDSRILLFFTAIETIGGRRSNRRKFLLLVYSGMRRVDEFEQQYIQTQSLSEAGSIISYPDRLRVYRNNLPTRYYPVFDEASMTFSGFAPAYEPIFYHPLFDGLQIQASFTATMQFVFGIRNQLNSGEYDVGGVREPVGTGFELYQLIEGARLGLFRYTYIDVDGVKTLSPTARKVSDVNFRITLDEFGLSPTDEVILGSGSISFQEIINRRLPFGGNIFPVRSPGLSRKDYFFYAPKALIV